MKHILLIVILAFCSLNVWAQLQTKFFNCTFGDTKEQVAFKMRNKGYTTSKENEGIFYLGLSFGGVNGWNVEFEYNKNILYRIHFKKSDSPQYHVLTDISRKIIAKYSQYAVEDYKEYYQDDFLRFDGGCKISDGIVTCYMYANRIRLPNNYWEYISNLVYVKSNSGTYSSEDDL